MVGVFSVPLMILGMVGVFQYGWGGGGDNYGLFSGVVMVVSLVCVWVCVFRPRLG